MVSDLTLINFGKLEILNCNNNERITDQGLKNLYIASNKNLFNKNSSKSINYEKSNLKKLWCGINNNFTDYGLTYCSNLIELDCRWEPTKFTNNGLDNLKKLKQLYI
jgi:hypothetical protein